MWKCTYLVKYLFCTLEFFLFYLNYKNTRKVGMYLYLYGPLVWKPSISVMLSDRKEKKCSIGFNDIEGDSERNNIDIF